MNLRISSGMPPELYLPLCLDALFSMRACQKGQPLQGLLLGTRFVAPPSGVSLMVTVVGPWVRC